jgi:GNAT superfamily N-acetyltransferase
MHIREGNAGDARAVAEVHVASWRWAYEGLIPKEFLDGILVEDREEMWREAMASSVPGRGLVVAEEDDDGLVGFAAFGQADDPEAAGVGEVFAIYVRPEVAGTGVGRDLFAGANDALSRSGFRRATLWVLEANARARRFYEKAGWAWDGTTGTHRFDCANLPVVRYAADLVGTEAARIRRLTGRCG